jgi:aconitate decarboxylase
MPPSAITAQYIVSQEFADLPPVVVEMVKRLILDAFAATIGGVPAPWCRALAEQVREWGGREESTLLFDRARVPAPHAAWVHSAMLHSLEYDAIHEGAIVHPLTAVFPAALAAAEARGAVSGQEFIAALALSVELTCRIGLAAQTAMTFYRGATCGGFGATLAAAKLWRLDAETTQHALGIAYSQLSGTLQSHREGASVNTMQSGFGAKAGIIAAALARRGITGPRECFTGPYGYYPLYEGGSYDESVLVGELGTHYEVLNISQKPYPCGRLTHGAVELALTLSQERSIPIDDITKVTVAASPFVQRLVGRPFNRDAPNPLDARLSLPFMVATALLRGGIDIAATEGASLKDPAVQALAQRVSVVVDPDLAPVNAPAPQRLEIYTRTGERIERRIDLLKGAPGRALSWDETVEKYWRCWRHADPPVPESHGQEVIERLERLEDEGDIRTIIGGLRPS